ncbi:MAG: UDP-N-acetylglucosamine 4,6-dehydratase (inverting) [Candidatus ainarchaeum sp.]|nr:UDP-N-acetylglucosamine 4,6-dehydratase (inverting) [Candidatus ainarchaeum sp.]MDD5096755.1 UDP-N-acetylglucosamine 4,6-dehydratase (inverting) [Candidatus ainarchaeum sp.]
MQDSVTDTFNGKLVLITGGTGSFGQKFTELVLKKAQPKAVRIYSRNELKQVEMERKLSQEDWLRARFFIGDVRDSRRLYRAMEGADIVIHAAALKHVPVCEYNPLEAVDTNINGARNVIDAALDTGVGKVLALSTDKAVQPVNLYGATKLVAEKLFVQANAYSGQKKTRFACVRYGNVMGSSGSVVPLFFRQKESGEVTITDERMTRFWITLEQGVDFVMKSISRMKGGEIFVPKIPSTKVTDLADVIAPGARRKVIGIRPGEKLHEILLTADEARHAREFPDHFVIEPEHRFWKSENHMEGKKLSGDFSYSSDNNPVWLSNEQIAGMLKAQGFL